jgi:hypothetical protein
VPWLLPVLWRLCDVPPSAEEFSEAAVAAGRWPLAPHR